MIRLVQRRLIIPRGDTGAFSIPALPSLQGGNNIAVFTIFSAVTRKKIFEKRIASIENNSITVEFEHKDTVNLPVGRYLWDIKIYNTPEFKNGDIETGDLIDGKVVDSYYSAFKLPECEITPSGDALLTADDAPHTTLPPDQINILRTAVSEAQASEQAAASSAEEANQSAQDAAASAETATQAAETATTAAGVAVEAANEIKDLSVEATTLATGSSATASYDSDTGVLSLGIPRGDDYILTNQDKADIAAIAEAGLAPSLDGKADKADTILLTSLSRGRTANTTIGEASFAFGHSVTASGLDSHAEGSNNVASAASTHAEGDSNVASASCAHVEGQSNTASGSYSHAEGRGTIASANGAHAEGDYATASNEHAHAEGSYTYAKGESSHAEGVGTGINGTHQFRDGSKTGIAATGTADHTEGYFTRTEVDGSHINYGNHAEGYETVAGSTIRQTQGAHAEGQQTVAEYTAAHAEGYQTTASGFGSHTEGVGATASAHSSHAEGNATTASGANSHAEGGGTAARGAQAHAEGAGSIASGTAAHAEGAATIASKDTAHAEGSYSIADGIAAHAEGDHTIATGAAVHAGGKFNVDLNVNNVTMAQIIGNGTNDNSRSNAYALSWTGDGYYKGDVYVNCDANSANGTKVATVNDLSDLSDSVAATYYTKPSGGIPATDLAETYLTQHQDISGKANIADLAIIATTGSYNDLSNKPTIPTKVSDLTNDAGYINGYTETDPTVPAWAKAAQKPTYTASEVGATTANDVSGMIATAIQNINSFDVEIVQELPISGIKEHTIYFVPKTGETNDVYDEYIRVNNDWEMIGNTQIDLSNYATKAELPIVVSDLTNDAGYLVSADLATVAATGEYSDLNNTPIIPAKLSDLTNDSDFMREYYGECNTAGDTASKQVTISNLTSFSAGTTIRVKFANVNTISNPTLEINGGSQIPIMRAGSSAAGSSASTSWMAGSIVALTYDGTNWIINNFDNTTYSSMTDAQVTAGTSTTNVLISPARLKTAIQTHAPVTSVNGQTGTVQLNTVEYGNFQNLTAAEQQMALTNLGLSNEALPISDDLYKSRVVSGGEKVKIDQIVGGTVAFNQLTSAKNTTAGRDDDNSPINLTNAEGGNRTFQSASAYNYTTVDGHKYFITWTVTNAVDGGGADGTGHDTYSCSLVGKTSGNRTVQNETVYRIYEGTTSGSQHKTNVYFYLSQNSNSATGAITLTNVMLIDLTQMFGSTIADYLASLENPVGGATNTGAGVALFRTMFPESYYPYNAGELVSVQTSGRKTVGFNLFDSSTATVGKSINASGTIQTSWAGSSSISDYIPVFPNTKYCVYYSAQTYLYDVIYYDASKTFIGHGTHGTSWSTPFVTETTPSNCAYARLNVFTHELSTACFNLSDPSRNGTYESYRATTYPLDSTVELRGIPVLSDGKVAYDGDQYAPDGTVTRRYHYAQLTGFDNWSYQTNAGYVSLFKTLTSMGLPASASTASTNSAVSGFVRATGKDNPFGTFALYSNGTLYFWANNTDAYPDRAAVVAAVEALAPTIVYELATPTTETAAPYQEVQIAGSTEEFLGTSVPVGAKDCYYCAQSIVDVKADKVQNATSGNFAALDANGNLTDSGHKHSDYLTAHQDLSNYVQKTDLATDSTAGVVKILPALGISSYGGYLMIAPANDAAIKAGSGNVATITATSQHQSVFYGLAKAAGADMASSSNAVGTYTDTAKGAIQKMLGVTDLFGNEENDVTATRAYAIGEAFVSNGKLYRATAAIAQDGAIVTDGNGANCEEISITEDFVKKTDIANSTTPGVMKVTTGGLGLVVNADKVLQISPADAATIKDGTQGYRPITPQRQHESVFYGLTKAAGADMKNSSNAVGTYTDTAKAAINNMIGSTSKAALEDAGITGYSYTTLFGGTFNVTTAANSSYINPYARASVTGRISKHYRHRVTVNGTVYNLKTRLWFAPGKVYEYLGNLNLYVSDISGVPGGTDNVPFVIISDLNDNSSIDVITQTAGAYTILVEQIMPTKKVLPKSLIWEDEYVSIEKKNNGGTYNGFSIGVNELKNTRATFAAGYMNSINGEFSEVIGYSNINNGTSSVIIGSSNTSSGAISHVFGNNNTNTGLNNTVIGSRNNDSGIASIIIGVGNTDQGRQNTLVGYLNQTSSNAANSTLFGGSLRSGSHDTTIVGNGNVLSTDKTYTNWAENTHYQVGDCVYNTTDYRYYQCLTENTDATFTASKWKKLPSISNACFIVGNGRSSNDERSNALSIDWNGNAKFGGDVYVNCASDSTGGNKLISEVDYATSSTAGVVKTSQSYGTTMTSGALTIAPASNDNIKGGTNAYKPIVPAKQDQAVFYGLAKVAGVDLASETVTLGTYPATASAAIRTMIGAVGTSDYATGDNAGVVKIGSSSDSTGESLGLYRQTNGLVRTAPATIGNIKSGVQAYKPIVSATVDAATFYGLAKAAGDTTQSSSSNAVGTYTAEAKGAIRAMLDVDDSIVEEYINSTSPSITAGPNCRYICGEVTSVSFTPCASGSCELMFTSGSSVAVLTLPSTVKMPEWFEVETNTIYDIIITNGVYGAVMSWPL